MHVLNELPVCDSVKQYAQFMNDSSIQKEEQCQGACV